MIIKVEDRKGGNGPKPVLTPSHLNTFQFPTEVHVKNMLVEVF